MWVMASKAPGNSGKAVSEGETAPLRTVSEVTWADEIDEAAFAVADIAPGFGGRKRQDAQGACRELFRKVMQEGALAIAGKALGKHVAGRIVRDQHDGLGLASMLPEAGEQRAAVTEVIKFGAEDHFRRRRQLGGEDGPGLTGAQCRRAQHALRQQGLSRQVLAKQGGGGAAAGIQRAVYVGNGRIIAG